MAQAQTAVPVVAPGGLLSGTVRDSATGEPVGFALVVRTGTEDRVFATEAGRFSLPGFSGGHATIRVLQIGYRPLTLVLQVDTKGTAAPGMPGLVIRLARQAVVLPEILVTGNVCTGVDAISGAGEGSSIIDEALKNAERLLALEKSYPSLGTFQRVTRILDDGLPSGDRRVDTMRYDSRSSDGYRKGRVLERRSRQEEVNFFTASDIVRAEFRKHHCFWYAGRDSVEGFPGYRIDFAPNARVKEPDWAGSLVIDSSSMLLLRAEARLVNIKPAKRGFRSGVCSVLYTQVAPTLLYEYLVNCSESRHETPERSVVAQWSLIDFAFLGKRPAIRDPAPP